VINYIGFQQDVTERVERQRQLQKIDQVLRHNLHNDLNVVQLHAERIRRDSDPPIAESATKIIEKTDSLIETVDKERDIVQLLERKPEIKPVELMATLESTVETLRTEYPGATISLTGPESVRVDGTEKLPVVFTELITNALTHNDSETPTVEVTVQVGEGTVTVEVGDNGPGIPEMEAKTVSGEMEETPLYHSGGLGLWFVYLVVRRCGGHIEFVDTASAGSTVAVVLNS
jgi:signal transduction histidine kinase